jgi:hypothetical protein
MSAPSGCEGQDVATLQLPADNHHTVSIYAMTLKNRLGDVETNCRKRLSCHPARHDLRQIVERGLNERPWKPYAQKSTPAEQILFLKVQNAYDVAARGQSDLGHDVGHLMVAPLSVSADKCLGA